MGRVSDIMANGSRKPIFGYHSMVFAIVAIAFLGWIVWGHHMFMSGMNPTLGSRSEEHTSELQSQSNLVCRLLLEKKQCAEQQPPRLAEHPPLQPTLLL